MRLACAVLMVAAGAAAGSTRTGTLVDVVEGAGGGVVVGRVAAVEPDGFIVLDGARTIVAPDPETALDPDAGPRDGPAPDAPSPADPTPARLFAPGADSTLVGQQVALVRVRLPGGLGQDAVVQRIVHGRDAEVVAHLDGALAAPDRRSAALALVRRPEPPARQAGLELLAELGAEGLAPEALELQDDPDPEVRIAVARLGIHGSRASLVSHAIRDSVPGVALAAIDLAESAELDDASGALEDVATQGEPAVRGRALDALGVLTPTVLVRILADVAEDPDPGVQLTRMRWTGHLGDEIQVLRATRAFLRFLSAGDGNSAYMLLHPATREGLNPLDLGKEEQYELRSFRIKSIDRLGPDSFGVDVRVVIERGLNLALRLDYLVVERVQSRFYVRRIVQGKRLPFG